MIKRLIWMLPLLIHDWIWIATGHILMGWKNETGQITRLEWRVLKDGKYS